MHMFPHIPQFIGSVIRLTQVPAFMQKRWPATGQPQRPLVHASPGLHAVPQAPQARVSVCVLTQPRPMHNV